MSSYQETLFYLELFSKNKRQGLRSILRSSACISQDLKGGNIGEKLSEGR
jgi:hypothetical protein